MILGDNFLNGGTAFPTGMGAGNNGDLFWRSDQKTLFYWDNGSATWAVVPGVPVGAIIAWHKNLTGVPSLPSNFKECNGTTINDAESPLNGQTIPNLNGDARFLRGSSTSGTLETSQNLSHSHTISPNPHSHNQQRWTTGTSGLNSNTANQATNLTVANVGPTTSATSLTIASDGGSEARPINMSVVWVMRIK